ncbi:MAG: FliA/WhiG family RNA polymerase sigma factor [Microthrixaceae bacterium]|nr:FliA/WhiG family RNA polymerase sigma factor [Microthrixaceae bacterium]MCB1222140.1 FliA/WhiG family RNA polymerase sigma factor [bacterium]
MPTKEEARILIEDNLNLVNHVVFQVAVHFPRHVDRQELARAGALGLVEAAQRYDGSRGVPFERFAAQRIRGAILDSVRSADWAPRSVRNLARRLDQVEQRLASELGRVPERDEVAKALGMTRDEIHRLQDRMFRSVVLAFDNLVADSSEEEMTLIDVLEDPKAVEPSRELEGREMVSFLRDAVKLLPERQRIVIVGYFLEDRTSQELAELLGVTESRISQMRTEALESMRRGIEAQYETEEEAPNPRGRLAKRRAGYANAIGEARDWKRRLDDEPELLPV